VLFDTAREAFVVALRVYLEMRPASRLRQVADRIESSLANPASDIFDDVVARAFMELMPLGNRAEDFGVSLLAIDAGLDLPDQEAYDVFHAKQDPQWLADFHRRLYEVRAAFAASREQIWLRLQPPYQGMPELLGRHATSVELAVATAKDRSSVRRLLDHSSMLGLFRDDLVLDKETGVLKTAHLVLIHERTGVPFPEITFVDDKVNHLHAVAPLGMRPVLASWGYNGERERSLARSFGYLVCTLEDVERQIFD
jgi:phosphoglycolate phosphatase-like HAD superfamily hydrolase